MQTAPSIDPLDADMDLPNFEQPAIEGEVTSREVSDVEPGPKSKAPPFDPSTLGFPMMLPVELALAEQKPREICEAYGISKEKFIAITQNPVFARAYAEAKEMLAKDGMTYRTKARMQAEQLLKTSWALIHDQFTPAEVKARLIMHTAKVAGYEPKEGASVVLGNALQININLG